MAYKAPVDRKTQERTKAGWQSLLWMFVGAILAVMIGVFLYLSPLFDGFRKEVEVNAPVEVAPLPQNTEKSNDYEFYEILPQRKFQGSDSGLGETPDPEIPEVEPRRKKEVDVVVELPREKILCEVKYRNNSHIPATDAIVELCKDEKSKVTNAFLVTKQLDDFGIAKHETAVPILRIPAIAFLYLLGKAEADGQNGKM